jgi:2-dehydropantoate 2-reductase
MRLIFLGMGAMGSLLAAMLIRKNIPIIGLCRGNHYEKIKESGLIFEDINKFQHIIHQDEQFQVFNSKIQMQSIFEQISDEDWIVITCKTYDLERLILEYKDCLVKTKRILLIQNGIGNEDIVHKILPNLAVYRATTTMGAFMVQPGYIRHTGLGITKIGFPSVNKKSHANSKDSEIPQKVKSNLDFISNIFNQAAIKTEIASNIDLVLWEKIFVNVGINALAALKNVPNGELLQDEASMERLKKLITEAWNIGTAMGIKLDDTPDKYVQTTIEVIRKTAINKNSMLQDLMKKKPTEIDYINGKIVQYAKKLGINALENEKITFEIKDREKGNLKDLTDRLF